jgi:hypothetical protein
VKGSPEPTKFLIHRQSTNLPIPSTDVAEYEHVIGFDWENAGHIARLNSWRRQLIRRFTGTLVHERRSPWTELERSELEIVIRDILKANGNRSDSLDWEVIRERLNSKFDNVVQPAGSPLALASASHGPQKVTMYERVGLNRTASGCHNQVRLFKNTTIRDMIIAAKRTIVANRGTSRRKYDDFAEDESEKDNTKESKKSKKRGDKDTSLWKPSQTKIGSERPGLRSSARTGKNISYAEGDDEDQLADEEDEKSDLVRDGEDGPEEEDFVDGGA